MRGSGKVAGMEMNPSIRKNRKFYVFSDWSVIPVFIATIFEEKRRKKAGIRLPKK